MHERRQIRKERNMSKNNDDDMRSEYDFSGGVRGKYYERFKQGTNLILLDPDIAAIFTNSKQVNTVLRQHAYCSSDEN